VKPKLEIVEKPVVEPATDWENRPACIPECLVLSDSLLEGEWYARQDEVDRNRRPVYPDEPAPVKTRKALQIEMFKSDHGEVFETDMKFESFQIKPDPKEGTLVGKLVLVTDVPRGASALELFGPLLKMQGSFVDVLVGGTTVTTKDLG